MDDATAAQVCPTTDHRPCTTRRHTLAAQGQPPTRVRSRVENKRMAEEKRKRDRAAKEERLAPTRARRLAPIARIIARLVGVCSSRAVSPPRSRSRRPRPPSSPIARAGERRAPPGGAGGGRRREWSCATARRASHRAAALVSVAAAARRRAASAAAAHHRPGELDAGSRRLRALRPAAPSSGADGTPTSRRAVAGAASGARAAPRAVDSSNVTRARHRSISRPPPPPSHHAGGSVAATDVEAPKKKSALKRALGRHDREPIARGFSPPGHER